MSAAYLRIGQIVRTHGVNGAVKCNPLTDNPKRFLGLDRAFLELRGELVPVRLKVQSATEGAVILFIDGYASPEQAAELKNVYICVERKDAIKLPEYTYFVADLIGCRVYDTEGKDYGVLTDVLETGANDVYVIENGRLMVPALKKVLHEVNVEEGRIVFKSEVLREVGLFED
ncbi:MAG: ribosome maturation factor RimM [Clostridia bacterium]|nr:ribosome maturation factor RimM [Clostridia bacterium]